LNMWKRRRFKPKQVFQSKKIILLAIFILILIFVVSFIRAKLFIINKVDIESAQAGCADEEEFRKSSNLLGQSFFLLNPKDAENSLKSKYFCVKSTRVNKKFPDTVKLQIAGRTPFAKILILKDKEASPAAQNPEGFFIVDEEGVVFAKDDIGGIPNIYLYDPGVALGKRLNGIYSNLLVILGKVKTFGINVREGWITDSSFVIKEGDGTPRIIFALEDEIDIQIASLQLILDKAKIDSSKLEFIDLRFDKPIIRFVEKSPK